MIVVDSSVWIGYLRGHQLQPVLWLRDHIALEEIATPDLGLCEILRGARNRREFDEFKKVLLLLPVLETGGEDLAVEAAERHVWLRSKGVTVRSVIDAIVATACIRGQHVLLHNDRDFDPFERYFDLKVVKP